MNAYPLKWRWPLLCPVITRWSDTNDTNTSCYSRCHQTQQLQLWTGRGTLLSSASHDRIADIIADTFLQPPVSCLALGCPDGRFHLPAPCSCAKMAGKVQERFLYPRCSLVYLLVCEIQQVYVLHISEESSPLSLLNVMLESENEQKCFGPSLFWKEQFGITGASPVQPKGSHLDPDLFSQLVSLFLHELAERPFLLPECFQQFQIQMCNEI